MDRVRVEFYVNENTFKGKQKNVDLSQQTDHQQQLISSILIESLI